MADKTVRHPAKFTDSILTEISDVLDTYNVSGRLLDPFAGTGKVHQLARPGLETVGVELEEEWATQHPNTVTGSALDGSLLRRLGPFNAACFSPVYGNRCSDHHEAKDDSRRNTYRHALGRPLSEGSSAGLQWGEPYREFHRQAYRALWGALAEGALIVVNVKDHIRKGELQHVSAWHLGAWVCLGAQHLETIKVPVKGNRQGANGQLRVDHEDIHILRKTW